MARPRTFDENEVLRAARDQFWHRGYAATSVDDLTDATGLGRGSLYGAFGDKRSLFLRALDDYCAAAIDDIGAQLTRSDLSAYDRLAAHVRGMAANVAADTERRGCLMARSSAELGAADADVDRVVGRFLEGWRGRLAEVLREAARDGSVRANLDPEATATMLLATIRGFEALGKGGVSSALVTAAADATLALLV